MPQEKQDSDSGCRDRPRRPKHAPSQGPWVTMIEGNFHLKIGTRWGWGLGEGDQSLELQVPGMGRIPGICVSNGLLRWF